MKRVGGSPFSAYTVQLYSLGMPIDAIKKLVAPPSLKKPAPDYVAKSKLAQRTGTTPAKAAASAATAIESAFRGKKAREKAAQEEAARKIESIWRGHASRAHGPRALEAHAEAMPSYHP